MMEMKNGCTAPLAEVPVLAVSDFRDRQLELVRNGCRVLAFFALPGDGAATTAEQFRLIAVLGNPGTGKLALAATTVGKSYPALTPDCNAFHLFEREIYEQHGIVPEGHPWLKPVRYTAKKGTDGADNFPGNTEFFKMDGEAVHEVAVGPIHAGVIEPGHFRFQCMGEDVYHLEISLGYQHRGIEKLMTTVPLKSAVHLAETAAGDTSAAAATAFAHLVEALSDTTAPAEAVLIRDIAMELERMACHVGDLGALAGDVAFLPTASFCGRIRGEYLNMTAELCGNRFGRGLIVPGGCRYGLDAARAAKLTAWLQRIYPELQNALDIMFDSPSVLDRLENTGTVTTDAAAGLGLVGPAGRASGLTADARVDFPLDGYESSAPAQLTSTTGDVFARARIRYDEIEASHQKLLRLLGKVGADSGNNYCNPVSGEALKADHIAVAVTEAWRGELVYVGVTDNAGAFRKVKIVDPSFHNWTGLAQALRGEQISNFPICNKSFNLSYCGHDL